MKEGPLKLSAQDGEDLQVIAAVLQDAIAPCCDMLYRMADKCFVMALHRFRWDGVTEAETGKAACFERVHCLLEVDGVEGVHWRGINQAATGGMMELLTMLMENGDLKFVFAGGAEIRLKLDSWRLRIKDFGQPWPTQRQPLHTS